MTKSFYRRPLLLKQGFSLHEIRHLLEVTDQVVALQIVAPRTFYDKVRQERPPTGFTTGANTGLIVGWVFPDNNRREGKGVYGNIYFKNGGFWNVERQVLSLPSIGAEEG